MFLSFRNTISNFCLEHKSLYKTFRFLVSGGTATFVNIFSLYIFVTYLHIWYVLASVFAFLCGFIISFSMQKFWTFEDHSKENIKKQFFLFFFTVIVGMILNTIIIFVCVEYFNINYIAGQFISGALIAVLNFFVYQKIIFQKNGEIQIVD